MSEENHKLDLKMDRICLNCGLSYGAHRGGNVINNQCPAHQSKMDWPKEGITIFKDSGVLRHVPYGTAADDGKWVNMTAERKRYLRPSKVTNA